MSFECALSQKATMSRMVLNKVDGQQLPSYEDMYIDMPCRIHVIHQTPRMFNNMAEQQVYYPAVIMQTLAKFKDGKTGDRVVCEGIAYKVIAQLGARGPTLHHMAYSLEVMK